MSPTGTFDWAQHSEEYTYQFGAVPASGPTSGVHLAGFCEYPTSLGSNELCKEVGWNQDSIYLADVSPGGAVGWSSAPIQGPTDMALDIDGVPYLLGLYSFSVTIGGTTLTASGPDDIFVWKVPKP